MKITLLSSILASLWTTIQVVDAFSAPLLASNKVSFLLQQQQQYQQQQNGGGSRFLASMLQSKTTVDEDEELEEEVAQMVAEAKAKSNRMSNLRNERGVEYAPWMGIGVEDEARIKGIMRERAEARRKREVEQQTTRGSLMRDSTNQELSGTGLKSKIIDSSTVELEWATGSEKNTIGFIVKRRTAKAGEPFVAIASYETFGPLASKGIDGGIYRYLDETVEAGKGYVYRITECESSGEENDLSQCLVDIQTEQEQAGTKIALAGLIVVAAGLFASALLLDPIQ